MDVYALTCANCGSQFASGSRKSKYCSPKCRMNHWRKSEKKSHENFEDFVRGRLAAIESKLDQIISDFSKKSSEPIVSSPKVVDNYKTLHDAIQSAKIHKEILDLEDQVKLNKFLTKQQKESLYQLVNTKINTL